MMSRYALRRRDGRILKLVRFIFRLIDPMDVETARFPDRWPQTADSKPDVERALPSSELHERERRDAAARIRRRSRAATETGEAES